MELTPAHHLSTLQPHSPLVAAQSKHPFRFAAFLAASPFAAPVPLLLKLHKDVVYMIVASLQRQHFQARTAATVPCSLVASQFSTYYLLLLTTCYSLLLTTQAGESVISEGEPVTQMGFVVAGELEVFSLAPSYERKLELIRVGEATVDAVQLGVLRRRKDTHRKRGASKEFEDESSSQVRYAQICVGTEVGVEWLLRAATYLLLSMHY